MSTFRNRSVNPPRRNTRSESQRAETMRSDEKAPTQTELPQGHQSTCQNNANLTAHSHSTKNNGVYIEFSGEGSPLHHSGFMDLSASENRFHNSGYMYLVNTCNQHAQIHLK